MATSGKGGGKGDRAPRWPRRGLEILSPRGLLCSFWNGGLLSTRPPLVHAPPWLRAASHSLAVLVIISADVAEVSSKRLHGQGTGDPPTLPPDDHPCGEDRRSHPCPHGLLPIPTDTGAYLHPAWPSREPRGRGRQRSWMPVPKSSRGLEDNIK